MEIRDDFDFFILPKNSGLKKCKEIAERINKDKSRFQEVRGEDVPLFVENLIKENKKAIGITGEDLFREFSLNNRKNRLRILKKIVWNDKNFLYKKPSLCFMGRKKF